MRLEVCAASCSVFVDAAESTSFAIGLFYRREYRGLLTAMKWDGDLQDFIEDKGWFESVFSLRGLSPEGLKRLYALGKRLEREERTAAAR